MTGPSSPRYDRTPFNAGLENHESENRASEFFSNLLGLSQQGSCMERQSGVQHAAKFVSVLDRHRRKAQPLQVPESRCVFHDEDLAIHVTPERIDIREVTVPGPVGGRLRLLRFVQQQGHRHA